MKEKSFFVYLASYLVLLIPTPGRFVFGFTLMLELFLLMILGTLVILLINKFKLYELKTIILLFSMILIAVTFRQIFIMLQPEIVLTLGYIIYLPPVSAFIISFLHKNQDLDPVLLIKLNLTRTLIFVIFGLLFFLFRDIIGYGTFTFFGRQHQIFEKVIFDSNNIGILSFFATIPGTLLLSSLIAFLHLTIHQKFKIIANHLEEVK